MSAIWHDHGLPSFFGIGPSFSFYEAAQVIETISEIQCAAYMAAMEDIKVREKLLGEQYFKDIANLAHQFYEMKRPWWL